MTGKTCPQCSKVFSRPGVMRAHLKAVHLGEKPFQCPQCPKAFGYKQALDEHARIAHQDVRPHACTNCNRRFHKAADLKKHQAIHARKGFVYRSSTLLKLLLQYDLRNLGGVALVVWGFRIQNI